MRGRQESEAKHKEHKAYPAEWGISMQSNDRQSVAGQRENNPGKDVLSWLVKEDLGSNQSCPKGQPILGTTTQQCSLWTCTNKAANKVVGQKSHAGDCLTERKIHPKQFKARFHLQRSKRDGLMLF